MKSLFVIGRMVLGGYFLYNGINHIRNHAMLSQYAGSKKVPVPEAAVAVSGAALLIGGASIALGIKPKLGALAIVGFLGAVSPVMHDFWRAEDPAQRMNDMVNFTKNMALLGSALALMGVEEPWPASLMPHERGVIERARQAFQALAA